MPKPPDGKPDEIADPSPVADLVDVVPTDTPTDPPDFDDPGDDAVPLARFQEVNQQATDERRSRQDLQTKYEALLQRHEAIVSKLDTPREPKPNKDADLTDLPQAPDGLNQLETAYWHIDRGMRRNFRKMLKEELGDVDKLKNLPVEAIKHNAVENEWSTLCETHEIDSSNKLTRLAFMQLLGQGATPAQAIETLKEAGATAPTKTRSATPITTGSVGFDVEKVMPRDNDHAGALAVKGKRVPDFGIKDVFRLREEQNRKRA